MKTLLKNGKIIDPLNDLNEKLDILIEDENIIKIDQINDKKLLENIDDIIDISDKIVFPGLIDLHTHLREPGFEEKETIKTGCEAAAAGGFTRVVCMANTEPVVDNPSTVEFIKSRAQKLPVTVYPVGSLTENMEGEELSEIGILAEAGVKVLSDDGQPVMNGEIMRRAMEYAKSFGLTVVDHCEDLNLVGKGVMNEGYYSTILGLKPIPAAAENIMISRDIILSELTGAQLHIAHLSTKRGVELVNEAKEQKLPVTAEVTPHHLILSDESIKDSQYDPNTKVNPPLRSKEDIEFLRKGLKEDIIDVIATDHAPHTFEDKLGPFDFAENGISGLETAVSLIYDKLIKPGIIDWSKFLKKTIYNPAQILDIEIKGIQENNPAEIVIFDPQKQWQVDPAKFKSKGKNTPFAGEKLEGKVLMTINNGKIIYDDRSGKNEIIY